MPLYNITRYPLDQASWGELCGLAPQDLTDDQLNKLSNRKLMEFATMDIRAEKLLANRFNSIPIAELEKLASIKEELKTMQYLKPKYNEYLATNQDKISEHIRLGYLPRDRFYFLESLDRDNLLKEHIRFSKSESSVVNCDSVSISFLFRESPEIALNTINHITNHFNGDAIVNMINSKLDFDDLENRYPTAIDSIISIITEREMYLVLTSLLQRLSKTKIAEIAPKLFDTKGAGAYLLSSPYIPEKYIVPALKIIAKRKSRVRLGIPITSDHLSQLAPVMRLDCIEAIIDYTSANHFSDITDIEAMKALLFSSVMRHHNRVEVVIKRFDRILRSKII